VFGILNDVGKGKAPAISDFKKALQKADLASRPYGWRLEYFVVDLVLSCREGRIWDDPNDNALMRIFHRKSGPISAAVSITIEVPENVELTVD
jgi:hypothetical protein